MILKPIYVKGNLWYFFADPAFRDCASNATWWDLARNRPFTDYSQCVPHSDLEVCMYSMHCIFYAFRMLTIFFHRITSLLSRYTSLDTQFQAFSYSWQLWYSTNLGNFVYSRRSNWLMKCKERKGKSNLKVWLLQRKSFKSKLANLQNFQDPWLRHFRKTLRPSIL